MLCLSSHAHTDWNKGLFALKPLDLLADKKEMRVEFFWQPRYRHNPGNKTKILTDPVSSKGLAGVDEEVFLCRRTGTSPAFIRSEEISTLKTDDPIERPLPSINLLEMQWILQRLVGMSGAAGWVPPDNDSRAILVDLTRITCPPRTYQIRKGCAIVTLRSLAHPHTP